jgi:hypothetical protein
VGYVDIRISKENAVLIRDLFMYLNDDMRAIAASIDVQLRRMWDEGHDQDALCLCGHPYHRHFDSYEDMEPIGCKYCVCDTFRE